MIKIALILQSSENGLWEGLVRSIFPFFYPEGNWLLPTIFIIIIVSVFIFFISFAKKKYKNSKSEIDEFTKELSKVTKDSIHRDFEEFRSRIIEKKILITYWKEFEKSIIKIKVDDYLKVYSTSDAEDYFNESNLVRKKLNIRLLNSASGILVTLGLIGTFIGISSGLGEISLAGSDSVNLTKGITTLLGGAQIAFSSSVWGLILSLIFNIYEKNIIQKLSLKVLELQEEIDGLFERKTTAGILTEALHEEREQTKQLMTFNDDLVFRLGEALDKSIQKSFNPILDTLLEAVQGLVDYKKESTEGAIKSMIEEFKSSMTDGANKQINELSTTLHQTASLLNKANEKTSKDQEQMQLLLKNHLTDFEGKIQTIMEDVTNSQNDLNNQQRNSLNGILESIHNGVDKTDEHFRKLLESTENSVNDNLSEIKDLFSNLSIDYEQNLRDLKEHFTSEKETMSVLIEKINTQLQSFDNSVKSMSSVSTELNNVFPLLHSTTSSLQATTNRFKDSQDEFITGLDNYLIETKSITNGNKDLVLEIQKALVETKTSWSAYEDRFGTLRNDLNLVFGELSSGLTNYQELTKSGLVGSLKQFDDIMGKAIGSLSSGIDEMKGILEDLEGQRK